MLASFLPSCVHLPLSLATLVSALLTHSVITNEHIHDNHQSERFLEQEGESSPSAVSVEGQEDSPTSSISSQEHTEITTVRRLSLSLSLSATGLPASLGISVMFALFNAYRIFFSAS